MKDRSRRISIRSSRKVAGFEFYNTSRYDFEKLLAGARIWRQICPQLHAPASVRIAQVFEKFDFDNYDQQA